MGKHKSKEKKKQHVTVRSNFSPENPLQIVSSQPIVLDLIPTGSEDPAAASPNNVSKNDVVDVGELGHSHELHEEEGGTTDGTNDAANDANSGTKDRKVIGKRKVLSLKRKANVQDAISDDPNPCNLTKRTIRKRTCKVDRVPIIDEDDSDDFVQTCPSIPFDKT